MKYLDTSVLVSALTRETASEAVREWMSVNETDGFAISDWVITEFSSALSIKVRSGQLALGERAESLTAFKALCRSSFSIVPVMPEQFRQAARFADGYELGLRGADSLHLAICKETGLALCTLDKRLGEAGKTLGVMTLVL